MEKKNMIMAEYAVHTFEDMEAEETVQTSKANNANLSPAIRRDSLDRLEVIGVVKSVYMEAAKKGVNVLGMRFDAAFYIATGKTLEAMKTPSMITNATTGFVSATDKIVDVAFDKTKVGLNKFASWLANKTK
jgi:hypothetical protein